MTNVPLAEFKSATGSVLDDSTLTQILSDADDLVNAYLEQYLLSGSSAPEIKSAAKCFAKVGLMEYNRLNGMEIPTQAMQDLRNMAYSILDQWVRQQPQLQGTRMRYAHKVNP